MIPVRALVWLHLDKGGDVVEAEFSTDISWMTIDPKMQAFKLVPGSRVASADPVEVKLSDAEANDVLLTLVKRERWSDVELTQA